MRLYFDTSYLVRLYLRDPGWEAVRELARSGDVECSMIGRAEALAAFHRKLREGAIAAGEMGILMDEFERDSDKGGFRWIPVSPAVVGRLRSAYSMLPPSVALRASDAVHLSCAAEAGFGLVYSNDRRLLDAAPYFGLTGSNVF